MAIDSRPGDYLNQFSREDYSDEWDEEIKKLFTDIKHFIESTADFSNSNVRNRIDEGEVTGNEYWQKLIVRAKELNLIDEE